MTELDTTAQAIVSEIAATDRSRAISIWTSCTRSSADMP